MEDQLINLFFGGLSVVVGFLAKNWLLKLTARLDRKNAELAEKQEKIERFLKETDKILAENRKAYKWNLRQQAQIDEIQAQIELIADKVNKFLINKEN